MRYIRLFEETTNQHYWTITRDEYDEVMDYASLSGMFWVMIFTEEERKRPIQLHYKCDQFDGLKKLLTDKKIFQG